MTTATFHIGANVTVRTHGRRTFSGTVESVTARTVTIEYTISADKIEQRTFRCIGGTWRNGGVWL